MKKVTMGKKIIFSAIIALSTSATLAQDSDKTIFDENCGICHGPGELGTDILSLRLGPERSVLAERDDLNAAYIKVVVRNGLVAMPPISRGDVSDPELDAIINYLTRSK